MYKLIFLLLLTVTTHYSVNAQNRATLKAKLQDGQPNDDMLSWITTDRDIVNQDQKTESEIDNEIDGIVRGQINKPSGEIEVPINFKKLVYYGHEDIRKLVLFSFDIFANDPDGNYRDAQYPKYIYKYGNLFIQSTNNTNRDQLNVYSIIRAYLIIKNRYPDIYSVLFEQTEKVPYGGLAGGNINPAGPVFLNANRNYIFTIHENSARALSATTTNYGWGGGVSSKAVGRSNIMIAENNNHFIFLNKATLKNGGAAVGSKDIYDDADVLDREVNNLFDGLIQTFVHERLHNYIGNYQSLDNYLNYIRNDVSLLGGGGTYEYIEEPIVTNTTNQVFSKYGGLSDQVLTYYSDLFTDVQLPKMRTLGKYEELMTKLKSLNGADGTEADKILQLLIFNPAYPHQVQQRQSVQVAGQQPLQLPNQGLPQQIQQRRN